MKEVKIGILGLGTVGAGVWRLLRENGPLIEAKSGVRITVAKAADLRAERQGELGIPGGVFTVSPDEVVNDPDISVVVELIGGVTAARELMLRALEKGKHVVTANKALLAEHGEQIIGRAIAGRVELGFEASVSGGIPIIKTIREALVGNRIDRLVGILNGTTNFILTKMTREGLGFDQALRAAQELGFAEADTTLDISGGDARHKITILSSFAFHTRVDMSRVYVEGIQEVQEQDLRYAQELGFVLKLLAIAERRDRGVLVRVHPTLVQRDNPLAAVSWEVNAVMVYSDYLGVSMYTGKGAGARPTASAVISDVTDIALKSLNCSEYNPFSYSFSQDLAQLPFSESRSRYYLRFDVMDRAGILSRIAGVLGENNISIASVIQKEPCPGQDHVPLVMMTHTAREEDVQRAVGRIDGLPDVLGSPGSTIIRVLDED
jgi:homoserine dehydrogenase